MLDKIGAFFRMGNPESKFPTIRKKETKEKYLEMFIAKYSAILQLLLIIRITDIVKLIWDRTTSFVIE